MIIISIPATRFPIVYALCKSLGNYFLLISFRSPLVQALHATPKRQANTSEVLPAFSMKRIMRFS